MSSSQRTSRPDNSAHSAPADQDTENRTLRYEHNTIEEKWLRLWEERRLFQSTPDTVHPNSDTKQYLLFAFAYPSGSGLHVGHVESKTALDIVSRYNRMQGKDVFFPVGWDAFGLPAENYAIKTGIHPSQTTRDAINTFRRQIKRLGISYDWASETATSHPGYYKWTQWIFLQLYKKGLAYQSEGSVNWCPSCQTVLANEQVVNGTCERCSTSVIQKKLKQWYFKISQYRDELISGLDTVDWPEPTKQQQLNWIGKKEGIEITYPVVDTTETVTCFTTRPDTNFGATFIVIAPEHPLALAVADGSLVVPGGDTAKIQSQVAEYLEKAKKKTELERQQEGRKKSGAFTGLYAHNQLNDTRIPIWISDFVLAGFGTGAVVGVPGHDVRDFEFAQSMSLPVKRVLVGPDGDTSEITDVTQVQEDAGVMVNSEFLNDMPVLQAIGAMMDHLEKKGWGKRVVSYKLRDWLISRQRYWGAPIPVVYDPQGQPHPVKEEHLPWTLPTDVDFKPTGESPLVSSKEFQERTEKLYGKGWRPEYDTMDTFVDSSWYFLRYVSARDESQFSDASRLAAWMPVDLYMIGPEHIVLHLLYARFFTKFLRDEGYFSFGEPFAKMRHQGMILGPDGKKMSKSKGNVINPDEVVETYGADTLRVYEMFMGPLEADKPWNTTAVAGVNRFLKRVYRLAHKALAAEGPVKTDPEVERKLHWVIKKVTQDIPLLKFNTAIAGLMEFINVWSLAVEEKGRNIPVSHLEIVVKLLAPFAPFLAEELWSLLGHDPSHESIHESDWPSYDPALAQDAAVTIVVQVNGKVRGQIILAADSLADEKAILAQAQALETVQAWTSGKTMQRAIYVPGKLVSLVAS